MADRPQLNPEDVAALKEMAQWWRNRGDGAMSRRRLLGLLAGGGLGAASVGGFMAGEASAGTDSVGQIGTQSEPADVYAEDFFDDGGNQPMSFPGDGSVSVEGLSLTPVLDQVISFSSGQTRDSSFTSPLPLSDVPIIVTANPDSNPGHDVGFSVDSYRYDSSGDFIGIRVTETENSGGGDARIVAWTINTP